MYFLNRLLWCFLFLLLASCHRSVEVVHYQVACKLVCLKKFDACINNCRDSCSNCSACSSKATANSYKQYVHEELVQGGFLVRQLNSYRDPLKCRKPTCNCKADRRVCEQSCEGVIHKRLQVPPTCC
ncbi:acyltransferase (plasmid) [Legionella adelaidensis]|uniref:Acyltransferase n=1 Tax=Legionella adelaidensis TaxID=45056 RepID=A0A0W0R532_9GAMM|nr:acyltransferase [Legionella adelaidensis]KTC66138.1 acyltransferase [Legionella adelaidensis]VEH85650.1 acyltransferase [Legionella adelaidensis]